MDVDMPALSRRLRSCLFTNAILTDDGARREAIAQQELADYKREAERRMGAADRWAKTPSDRAIIHGLPQRIDNYAGYCDFLEAKEAGCKSQDEAEEWFRQNYGPSAVEHTGKR